MIKSVSRALFWAARNYHAPDQTAYARIRRWLNFFGRHRIDFRGENREQLLVVVAGYKQSAWPMTLGRIAQYAPPGMDVCVVCPGRDDVELSALCARRGWSYLTTASNKLALAQNLAIRRHPKARFIHKLDEDILVSSGYFEAMTAAWAMIENENRVEPGILSPLLNVNGYTSRIFLEERGLLPDYLARFGECRSSCMNTSVWKNPEAACFLWDASAPFDQIASSFRAKEPSYSVCPHRFSIGAIFFPRRLWETLGGFTVDREEMLGVEEMDLCAYLTDHSLAICVAHHVFAGHIGFGPQTATVLAHLKDRRDLSSPSY